jgi:hypothetical protein
LIALTALALVGAPAPAAQDTTQWDRIRIAMNLPVRTTEAREWGVPEERVKSTIWDIRRGGVSAEDASRIFDEEVRVVREGGSKDNFGAFVKSRVEAGLRGRELADAIHAEHARRGMGKPAGAGKPGDAGRRDGTGRPNDAGKPDDAGRRNDDNRPDQAGGRGQGQGQGQDQGSEKGRKP